MKEIFYYIILLLLLIISIEDYRYRAVTWIFFPLLLAMIFCYNLFYISAGEILLNFLLNISFLLFVLIIITGYYSFKNKGWINIANGMIGWGDILFLASVSILFAPVNFLLFYCITLFLIILSFPILSFFKSFKNQIPLAGIQASLLSGALLFSKFYMPFDFTSNNWITSVYING